MSTINNPDRDTVLFAFFEECERPTAHQIAAWVERYPEFADDIRAHAAVRLEIAEGADASDIEPDNAMLSRSRSRALNAIYLATQQHADTVTSNHLPATWDEALQRKQTNIPALARKIDIDRMVLAELSAGRMRWPFGSRLVDALTQELDVNIRWLKDCVAVLVSNPRLGLAKSSGPPTLRNRSYEEVIRSSTMTDERKRYWLGEN